MTLVESYFNTKMGQKIIAGSKEPIGLISLLFVVQFHGPHPNTKEVSP
jgi:hypothetical protein